jgi:hypothetical protein
MPAARKTLPRRRIARKTKKASMTSLRCTLSVPWLRPVGLAAALILAPGTSSVAPGVSVARAQPTTFTGAALVPLQGESDVVKARAQALTEALTRALEQAVAEVMPEARSRVYLVAGRARDYVTTYRVLQEGEVAGQFQLRVEAQLDLPRLQRELVGAAGPTATASTLHLCAAQTSDATAKALEAARSQLKDTVTTVELAPSAQCTETPEPGLPRGALLALTSLSPTEPAAEPIRGTQPLTYGAVWRSEWRLSRPGHEPLRESAEAAGFGPDPATAESEGSRQAALAGLARVLSRSGPLQRRSQSVLVRIENLGSYRAYQQLVRVLSSLPGVTRADIRRFVVPSPKSGEDSVAQVLLTTGATVEALGATLGRTPIPGLRLQVAPVNAGELRVLCVASDAVPSASAPPDPSDAAEPEKLP